MLDILATQLEKEHDITSKVKGALIYPAVILVAMVGIAVLMLTYISVSYTHLLDIPVSKLKKSEWKEILFGESESDTKKKSPFPGVIPLLEKKYRETKSEHIRCSIEKFMTVSPCPSCAGKRLRKESLAVFFDGKTIDEISNMSIDRLSEYFSALSRKKYSPEEMSTLPPIFREVLERLDACLLYTSRCV